MNKRAEGFEPLTPKLALQLTSPHSWVASIMPVCIAACLSVWTVCNGSSSSHFDIHTAISNIDFVMVLALLAISILFQSSVNVINDYFDYAKGTDTKENQPDPSDAVLVYNNLNPKHVLALAIGFIVLAFVLGLYVIYRSGWVPLVIALLGVLVIYSYSGGKHPISYFPLGEIVSGFTMGGLITFASYVALTGKVDPLSLLVSIPIMIGIALIMATNNTCDIQKDIEANRKTYAVLVGYERAIRTYRAALIAWVIALLAISIFMFSSGCLVAIIGSLMMGKQTLALYRLDLDMTTRPKAFGLVTSLNKRLGLVYALTILMASVL